VCVDGRDQFPLWGAFRGGPLPKVALRYARDRAVEASVVLPGRVRHVRRIEWDAEAGEVIVHDSLEGKGHRRVESRLLLAPEPPPLAVTAAPGEIAIEQASTAERFGERVETIANVVEMQVELPVQLGFRITLEG
jgi:hypothetical protein